MKRFIALLTVLILVLSMAACAKTEVPSKTEEVPEKEEIILSKEEIQSKHKALHKKVPNVAPILKTSKANRINMETYNHNDVYTIQYPTTNWIHTKGENIDIWAHESDITAKYFVSMEYAGESPSYAITAFVGNGEYVFDELVGGMSADDMLEGVSADQHLAFFCTETGIVVACTYSDDTADIGAQMKEYMATFAEVSTT